MSDWDDPYDGDEEHDPITLSPQVQEVFDYAVTPPDARVVRTDDYPESF
ncbi:hypothetical protein [Kitasatospora sp. NBC_01266]|nr:hypothetical protein [Kitasatospora sp. NBC_01266]